MEKKEIKIKYLEHIPACPKRDRVMTRIGYRKNTTILDERHVELVDEGMRLGQILCSVRGAYGIFPIAHKSLMHVELSNGIIFESESLSGLLSRSQEVVLMASTAGKEVTDRISREVKDGNAALGVILDSVASQTADEGLNWLMEFLNKLLAREGKKLTRHRYSPGFGDLPLSYQRILYEALGLEKLHMELTERFMLMPEKSVIAIAGIENHV